MIFYSIQIRSARVYATVTQPEPASIGSVLPRSRSGRKYISWSHDAYVEVAEDSLPSWDPKHKRASEVVDTLWVLKRKRDGNNAISKYKGRIGHCV